MLDVRFTVALHILILLSQSPVVLTSEDMAKGVNKNSSYIRKIMASLKKHKIIENSQGKANAKLLISKDKLSLWEIYKAVQNSDVLHVWDVHKPNEEDVLSRHVGITMERLLAAYDEIVINKLKQTTLDDVMRILRSEIDSNELADALEEIRLAKLGLLDSKGYKK